MRLLFTFHLLICTIYFSSAQDSHLNKKDYTLTKKSFINVGILWHHANFELANEELGANNLETLKGFESYYVERSSVQIDNRFYCIIGFEHFKSTKQNTFRNGATGLFGNRIYFGLEYNILFKSKFQFNPYMLNSLGYYKLNIVNQSPKNLTELLGSKDLVSSSMIQKGMALKTGLKFNYILSNKVTEWKIGFDLGYSFNNSDVWHLNEISNIDPRLTLNHIYTGFNIGYSI